MIFFKTLIILTIVLINFHVVAAGAENEFGAVRAWFNGENATISGIELRIGEPVEVKVEITSKISGDVILKLYEPGVTKSFDVIKGPSDFDRRIDNLNIESGWSKTYTWTVSPNGNWKNGNAPINVIIQFFKGMNDKKVDFTIANPYILDEQYTGAHISTTGAPEAADTGAGAKAAPFISVVFAICALIFARRRIR